MYSKLLAFHPSSLDWNKFRYSLAKCPAQSWILFFWQILWHKARSTWQYIIATQHHAIILFKIWMLWSKNNNKKNNSLKLIYWKYKTLAKGKLVLWPGHCFSLLLIWSVVYCKLISEVIMKERMNEWDFF